MQIKEHLVITLYTFLLFSIILIIIGYLLVSSVNENVFTLNHISRVYQRSIMPQGWAFFTKNCREPYFRIYKQLDTKFEIVDLKQNRNNPITSFDRIDRYKLFEISKVIEIINVKNWHECENSIDLCLSGATKFSEVIVENKEIKPIFCGSFYIIIGEYKPWAWAELVAEESVNNKVSRINIKCNSSGNYD
jgi:antimicrobial peptide system SdpA family protein